MGWEAFEAESLWTLVSYIQTLEAFWWNWASQTCCFQWEQINITFPLYGISFVSSSFPTKASWNSGKWDRKVLLCPSMAINLLLPQQVKPLSELEWKVCLSLTAVTMPWCLFVMNGICLHLDSQEVDAFMSVTNLSFDFCLEIHAMQGLGS